MRITDASKLYGYSIMYIGFLCRTNKIKARKIKNDGQGNDIWDVNEASLAAFVERAEARRNSASARKPIAKVEKIKEIKRVLGKKPTHKAVLKIAAQYSITDRTVYRYLEM